MSVYLCRNTWYIYYLYAVFTVAKGYWISCPNTDLGGGRCLHVCVCVIVIQSTGQRRSVCLISQRPWWALFDEIGLFVYWSSWCVSLFIHRVCGGLILISSVCVHKPIHIHVSILQVYVFVCAWHYCFTTLGVRPCHLHPLGISKPINLRLLPSFYLVLSVTHKLPEANNFSFLD